MRSGRSSLALQSSAGRDLSWRADRPAPAVESTTAAANAPSTRVVFVIRLPSSWRERRRRTVEWLEELRDQEGLEPIPSDSEQFPLLRIQRDTTGPRIADPRPLDDGARRNVAGVIRPVDSDEPHLIEARAVVAV